MKNFQNSVDSSYAVEYHPAPKRVPEFVWWVIAIALLVIGIGFAPAWWPALFPNLGVRP